MGLFLLLMPYKIFQQDNEYCVYKVDDNDNQTGSSLGCHATEAEAQDQMAALYAAEGEEMDRDSQARSLFDNFWQGLKSLFIERRIKDVQSWDGSASNYATTESYCNACLINLNDGSPEDWTQVNCKLPVREDGDSSDTYVRQAVHAAAQRIDQVDAPPEDKQRAARELVRAYSEMDEESPESLTSLAQRAISGQQLNEHLWQAMFRLDEQYEGSDNYLVDVYHDNGGMYALFTDRGKLYRHQVTIQNNVPVLGERIEVMEMHVPVGDGQTRTIIRQQEDGSHRWVSVSATAVINRVGEIDSRDLFDSFIQYALDKGADGDKTVAIANERSIEYFPIRMFYHQGNVSENWEIDDLANTFRTGQADFLARDGYCYITSGLYDDTPLAQAEIRARQANPDYWGDSIGFWPTKTEMTEISDGINIPVHRQGFNVEISTLPENEAASLFTRTEVNRMSLFGKARDAFFKLFDDEEAAEKWLEENPEARNRAIEAAGMITRNTEGGEGEAPEANEPEPSEGEQPQAEESEVVVDDEVLDNLTKRVGASDFILAIVERLEKVERELEKANTPDAELVKTVGNLTQRLEALETSESKKRQQWQDDLPARANGKTRIVYRPREQRGTDDNEVNEAEDWAAQKANNKNIPSY